MSVTVEKILWEKSVFFFDVDDTLINTAAVTPIAAEEIKKVFASNYSDEVGRQIETEFNHIFATMTIGHKAKSEYDWIPFPQEKSKYDDLMSTIEQTQVHIRKEHGGIRKWSREFFIWYAAKSVGLTVAPEIILEAADAYWLAISEKTTAYPSAIQLLQTIHEHNRPVFLVTGSDARLTFGTDGQFHYDPSYSEGFKRGRMQLLREKGITFHGISIGDPEEKPHKDFFLKGIRQAQENLGMPIDLRHAIVMGDSYAADLQTPKEQLNFGLAVLYDIHRRNTEIVDDHYAMIGSHSQLLDFLK